MYGSNGLIQVLFVCLRSEGFLCLQSGSSQSQFGPSSYLTQQLSGVFSGQYREMRRQRIRVTLGTERLPVLALNEVFVGEKNVSQWVDILLSYLFLVYWAVFEHQHRFQAAADSLLWHVFVLSLQLFLLRVFSWWECQWATEELWAPCLYWLRLHLMVRNNCNTMLTIAVQYVMQKKTLTYMQGIQYEQS